MIKNLPKPVSAEWGIWNPKGGPGEEGCWLSHTDYRYSGPATFHARHDAIQSAIDEFECGCLDRYMGHSGPVIVCRFSGDLSDAAIVEGDSVKAYCRD